MPNTPQETLFPKNPAPGQLVQLPNREIFMYDGSMWILLGGKHVRDSFRNEIINYVSKYDPHDSISMLKADLRMLVTPQDLWEEIIIDNIIKITQNIQNSRLHT